jgi:hypothetical protein
MYRGSIRMNDILRDYFKIENLEKNWEVLVQKLGADNFSDGETLGAFTTYFPKYTGPDFNTVFETNRFNVWGIKPEEITFNGEKEFILSRNPPLLNCDNINDIKKYTYPKIEWFDFGTYINNSLC